MLLNDKRYVRGRGSYRHSVVYIHMRSMYIMIIHTFKMDFILKVKRRSFFEKILLDRNIYLHTIHVCAIKLIHRMFRYMNGLLKTMYIGMGQISVKTQTPHAWIKPYWMQNCMHVHVVAAIKYIYTLCIHPSCLVI